MERRKGITMMVLSALFFAIMAALVKSLEEYPLSQKMFFRNFLGFIFAFVMVKKTSSSIKGNNIKLLVLRSVLGLLGVAFYFYSIHHLNLADAVIINKLSPFVVVILSIFILKENVTRGQIIALLVAIIGSALVVRPKLDVSILPALIGVLAAIFAGAAYTTISYLRKTDRPETIVFYFTLITSIVVLPFAIKGNWILPKGLDILKAIGLGLTSTAGQIFMTYGYRYADASEISIYSYLDIIFSMFIGIVLFSEVPNVLTIIGGILILIAAIVNFQIKKSIINRERKN